ncbi:MAG: winged helix-turn-helix transcriptional regulator [Fimbriimonadaceae bacterium]|nr:MAG: winged helix-turn-helix transcriptional regulator [Fimbriimonadaceae bacterium]
MTEAFKALADPSRRQILRLLQKGEMNVGMIAEKFEFTAPTLSHHLNYLKKADLVRVRREGQQLIYSLNTTVVQDVVASLMSLTDSAIPNPEVQQ